MAVRLVQIYLPASDEAKARGVLEQKEGCDCLGVWSYKLAGGQSMVQFLIKSEQIDTILDLLSRDFASGKDFRIVLLPVEGTLPRLEAAEVEQKKPEGPDDEEEEKSEEQPGRISREELYTRVTEQAVLTKPYVILVVLSSIVAAVGLVRNEIAVVIGAMVIAPLLGPNVALSLGTTLGDLELMRRSLKVNAIGLITSLLISALIGYTLSVSAAAPQIASRTHAGLSDIALALAAGGAGALSFTMGASTALVGVMVAVALLPPLVVFGMLLGAMHWVGAMGALLLILVNLICINLAGVLTFIAQGIRPSTWWERDRARKATRWAILSWILLLLALSVTMVLSHLP